MFDNSEYKGYECQTTVLVSAKCLCNPLIVCISGPHLCLILRGSESVTALAKEPGSLAKNVTVFSPIGL